MSEKFKKFTVSLFFFGIGIISLWGISTHIDVNKTLVELCSLKASSVILVVLVTSFAYFLRAFRWMLLLNTEGSRVGFVSTFSSLMYGYFVNLGIPRLGEITRAGAVNKQEKKSFSFVIGTIISERFIDILSLISLLIFYSLCYSDILKIFYKEKISPYLIELPSFPIWIMMIVIGAFLVGVYLFFKKLPTIIQSQMSSLVDGLKSVLMIPNKMLFIVLTMAIWLSYFFTSYICFFSFNHPYDLSVTAGVSVLILGSVARSLPVQGGGVGVFHAAVVSILTLSFFGVYEQTDIKIALFIHAIQTLFQLVFGGFSAVYIVFSK
jgi:uncharacterized protein (TIRG00374 family)